MKECQEKQNLQKCNCTWEPCGRKGTCCECIQYHWNMDELPACLFPGEVEKIYDRSINLDYSRVEIAAYARRGT